MGAGESLVDRLDLRLSPTPTHPDTDPVPCGSSAQAVAAVPVTGPAATDQDARLRSSGDRAPLS